jgi:hypothetical protein
LNRCMYKWLMEQSINSVVVVHDENAPILIVFLFTLICCVQACVPTLVEQIQLLHVFAFQVSNFFLVLIMCFRA